MASVILADNGVSSGSAGLKSSADSSGVLALATGTGTTAVTIDASQNVGIGTSSPLQQLHLSSASANGLQITYQGVGAARIGVASVNALTFGIDTANGATERARIDSSGNLLVGTTSVYASCQLTLNPSNNGLGINRSGAYTALALNTDNTGSTYANFLYGGVQKGFINTNGSSVTYSTTSDYRLKENVQPMTGALAKVAALKPCTYTWKENGSEGQGFIAHELQAVVPDAVVGEKDAVDEDGNPKYQGIDTSFLVATLTAAIQEQQALITTLTERITALEAK